MWVFVSVSYTGVFQVFKISVITFASIGFFLMFVLALLSFCFSHFWVLFRFLFPSFRSCVCFLTFSAYFKTCLGFIFSSFPSFLSFFFFILSPISHFCLSYIYLFSFVSLCFRFFPFIHFPLFHQYFPSSPLFLIIFSSIIHLHFSFLLVCIFLHFSLCFIPLSQLFFFLLSFVSEFSSHLEPSWALPAVSAF